MWNPELTQITTKETILSSSGHLPVPGRNIFDCLRQFAFSWQIGVPTASTAFPEVITSFKAYGISVSGPLTDIPNYICPIMTKPHGEHPTLPVLTLLLAVTPFATLALTLRFLVHLSKTSPRSYPRPTGMIFQSAPIPLPPSFVSINALLSLPRPIRHALLVSDVETNELYYMHENIPALAIPLVSNAGKAKNESEAAALRRPGVAGMAVYDAVHERIRVVVARNAARDIAMFTLSPATAPGNLQPFYGESVTVCNSFNGSRLNSPHSLHVDGQGNLFFTDPTFGLMAAPDEFDRALDAPEAMELRGQNLYYVPVDAVRNAVQSGVSAVPRLLLEKLDRPVGLAVIGNRLLVAIASPRRPMLAQFMLSSGEDGGLRVVGDMRVLHDWSQYLHGWGQGWFSGVLGHLCVVKERWIFVGAGDGLVAFDIFESRDDGGMLDPIDRISLDFPPGPPSAIMSVDGHMYVAASDRVIKLKIVSA